MMKPETREFKEENLTKDIASVQCFLWPWISLLCCVVVKGAGLRFWGPKFKFFLLPLIGFVLGMVVPVSSPPMLPKKPTGQSVLPVRFLTIPYCWNQQNLFTDSTPVKKVLSQVVTWPAATMVFLPKTREAEERDPGNEVDKWYVVYLRRQPEPRVRITVFCTNLLGYMKVLHKCVMFELS